MIKSYDNICIINLYLYYKIIFIIFLHISFDYVDLMYKILWVFSSYFDIKHFKFFIEVSRMFYKSQVYWKCINT